MHEEEWARAGQELLEAVGAVLQQERRHRKLRQKEIAEIAGLNSRTISDIENANNGSHITAHRYATALGVRWSVVIARAERMINERRIERGEPLLLEVLQSKEPA